MRKYAALAARRHPLAGHVARTLTAVFALSPLTAATEPAPEGASTASAAPAPSPAPAPGPAPAASSAPATDAPAAQAAPSQAVPIVAPAGEPSAAQTSEKVLELYVQADDAGALATVRAGLERCDDASRRECPDSAKALLQRDLGIVLAGGSRDHAGAVAAFRDALHLDRTVTIPPDLLIERVRTAFAEAGGKVDGAPAAAARDTAPEADTDYETEPPKTSRYDSGDTFLLIVASLGGGGTSPGVINGEYRVAASGAWHVAGPLTIGARLSVGGMGWTSASVYGTTAQYGVMGAAAEIGVLPRGKRNTGYVLLGFGPDYIPNLGRVRAVISLPAGAAFGGFTIGGMPAVTIDDGFVGGTFTFLIGWGGYVKD